MNNSLNDNLLNSTDIPTTLVDRIDERVRMHLMRACSDTTSPSLEEDDFNQIQAQLANLDSATTTELYNQTMDWIQGMAAGVVRKMLGTI